MKRPLLSIGQEFRHPHSGHVHRVTDVGGRTFLTIDTTSRTIATHDTVTKETTTRVVSGDECRSYLAGPPYGVAEQVWDGTTKRFCARSRVSNGSTLQHTKQSCIARGESPEEREVSSDNPLLCSARLGSKGRSRDLQERRGWLSIAVIRRRTASTRAGKSRGVSSV
jgi:hypothetical protein